MAAKAKKKTTKKIVAKKRAPKTNLKSQQITEIREKIMTQEKTQYAEFMQSGNSFMKGFEDITKACMGLAQSAADKNAEAAKAMFSCKDMNEFTEMQSKLVQENMDDFMSGATKISELSVKIATETFEPINDQINKGIKKATDSLAA